jgi:uncharacterized membrane protein
MDGRTERPVTERGLDRLVNFGDAVVAIAITLLVLPLLELHAADESAGFTDLLRHHEAAFVAFFLSFVVIGRLWLVHHQLFESVEAYDGTLLGLHMLWLLTIAFLPFPTALIGGRLASVATNALYVGTLTASSACLASMRWHIERTPAVRGAAPRKSAREGFITTALFALALVLTVSVPDAGLWPMVVLVFEPVTGYWVRRRRRAPGDRSAPAESERPSG